MSDANVIQEKPVSRPKERVLSRIYITEAGDVVVTDLWGDVQMILKDHFSTHEEDRS